jgi:hypothetical protein
LRRILSSLFLFLGFSLVACGSSGSGGMGTAQPGGGCASGGDCASGLCAKSQDFPGGYCTQGCSLTDPNSCPAGSVCIDDASGVPPNSGISAVCYQTCNSNTDCTRAGYQCLEKSNHMVCRNGN